MKSTIIISASMESFWARVQDFWTREEHENLIQTNIVDALEVAYWEEEVYGLLHGQRGREEEISRKRAVMAEVLPIKKEIQNTAKKAWEVLDNQDREDLKWNVQKVEEAWKTMQEALREEIKELDKAVNQIGQQYELLPENEKQVFMDAIEEGFLTSLSLERLIALIDWVDEPEASFLSFTDKKKVKLGCFARLHHFAPKGEWEEDYKGLLGWWKLQQENALDLGQEIESHGDVPFSSEDEIIAAIDANRRYNDLYKTLYIRFCREGIDAKRAKMEAFAVTCLQNMD